LGAWGPLGARAPKRGRRAAAPIAAGAIALLLVPVVSAGTDPPEPTVLADSGGGWVEGGSTVCTTCHDKPAILGILETPHAVKGDRRTPFAQHGCETCHGPGADHVAKQVPIGVRFGPEHPAEPQNQVCLGCHQGGARIHWSGSAHESHDVSCASCHDVHAARDVLFAKDVRPETFVKANQSQVCFTCHPQVRAEIYRISAHPLKQGMVECSDCHNVHGSVTDALLKQETLNETCYECHAEKRGPFLWEHQPARDDCTNCHVPHGSNHRSLLEARTPWLCQSCHDASRHPGTAYSGSGLPGASPNRNLLLKSCLNCHTEVHGSNHPSGVRFTR
jgi:DmsE family decaheme c-type cytochrome